MDHFKKAKPLGSPGARRARRGMTGRDSAAGAGCEVAGRGNKATEPTENRVFDSARGGRPSVGARKRTHLPVGARPVAAGGLVWWEGWFGERMRGEANPLQARKTAFSVRQHRFRVSGKEKAKPFSGSSTDLSALGIRGQCGTGVPHVRYSLGNARAGCPCHEKLTSSPRVPRRCVRWIQVAGWSGAIVPGRAARIMPHRVQTSRLTGT